MYLVINLYPCGFMDIYFTPWVTTKNYLFCCPNCSRFGPWVLSLWFLCFFDRPLRGSFVLLSFRMAYFLIWPHKTSSLIQCLSCLSGRVGRFSTQPWRPLLESGVRNQAQHGRYPSQSKFHLVLIIFSL